MDIAALLSPGSATPALGVPTAPTPDAAAPGEAFSDLLVAAMVAPTEAVVCLPGVDVVPVDAVLQSGTPVAVAPIAPEAVPVESVPEPEVASRSSMPEGKAEPTPSPIANRRSIEDPPEPPPIEKETSRKDANAEAPNAPATEQDRPEAKAEESVEALVAQVMEAPAMPLAAVVAPTPPANPTVTVEVATSSPVVSGPKPKSPSGEAKPVPIPAGRKEVPLATDSIPVELIAETDLAASPSLESEPKTFDTPNDTVVPIGQPVVTSKETGVPKQGKSTPEKGQRLESAPDLGVVPQVTVGAPEIEKPIETPQTFEKAVAKKTKGETALIASASAKAATEPAETKVADATEESVQVEAIVQEQQTNFGGDAAPNDGQAPRDNPVPAVATTARTAATERPEVGSQRPEVDRHLVVRQVADRIESLVAARPREGVTIHLEPRDLGSVTLVVKGLASSLDVQMTASDERVRESLDGSRPELAQALAPRGIELRELRVASTPTNASGTTARDAGTNPDGRPRQQAPTPQQPSFANHSRRSNPAQATTRSLRSGRGVDLLA